MLVAGLMLLMICIIIGLFYAYTPKDEFKLNHDDMKLKEVVRSTLEAIKQVRFVRVVDIKNENYTMNITLVLRNNHTMDLQCDKNRFIIDDISYMFTTQSLSQQVKLLIEQQCLTALKKAV